MAYSNVRKNESIEMLGIPKAHIPKRKDEICLNGNGYESRKKLWDASWLNPKTITRNGKSAGKPRTEESSTTIGDECNRVGQQVNNGCPK